LYDENNETAGALVPAQIIYDAFYGRYHNSTGAVVFLCIIWGSSSFCGLSVTASAARVVRDRISFSFSKMGFENTSSSYISLTSSVPKILVV
jgi:hypothetical protein